MNLITKIQEKSKADIPIPNKFWFTIWVYGKYPQERASSWAIYQLYRSDEILCKNTEWEIVYPSLELNMGTKPQIQLEEWNTSSNSEQLTELVNKGRLLKIPIVGIRNISGKDGQFSGIMMSSPNASEPINLYWWGKGPSEWATLISWHRELIRFCKLTRGSD